MSMDRMAPGEDANPLHSDMIGERIVESMGRDVNAEMNFGAEDPIDKVALPMDSAANASIPTAKFSVETALLFPFLSTFVDEVN